MGASDFSKLPHIGEPVKRKEDYRFLTGAGQYTDDIALAAQAHAVFVRSPHAHARVRSVSTDAARAAPGVIGVLTGADVAADKINGLPCGWLITSTNGEPMKEPPHPILALDTVRYVGDQVAMVVAETLEQARDAAELVEVDYDPLPAVVLVADAAAGSVPGAVVHDIAPDNHCYKWAIGDKAAVDAVFAGAAHIAQQHIVTGTTNKQIIGVIACKGIAIAGANQILDAIEGVSPCPTSILRTGNSKAHSYGRGRIDITGRINPSTTVQCIVS